MKKITIVSLIAIFFIGCNGGGLIYPKLQKELRNLMLL